MACWQRERNWWWKLSECFDKCRSPLSSLPPLRLWGYGSVWDSSHKVRIWRKTRENLPVVPQVWLFLFLFYFLFKTWTEGTRHWTKDSSLVNYLDVFCSTCSSPDSKKDFLKAVHSILREKQRRQLLKTESLPPNQQYVPFGGKRLCALKGARPTMNREGDKAQV